VNPQVSQARHYATPVGHIKWQLSVATLSADSTDSGIGTVLLLLLPLMTGLLMHNHQPWADFH